MDQHHYDNLRESCKFENVETVTAHTNFKALSSSLGDDLFCKNAVALYPTSACIFHLKTTTSIESEVNWTGGGATRRRSNQEAGEPGGRATRRT